MTTIFTMQGSWGGAPIMITVLVAMLIGLFLMVIGGLWLTLLVFCKIEESIIHMLHWNREFIAFAWKRACDRRDRRDRA